jgi:iron complex transport system ATP-binding protein
VLVLDEPTAFLDIAGRVELTLAIAELAREGLAVIASTHDLELALSHADRVWLVADGTVRAGRPHEVVAGGHVATAFSDGNVEVDDALAGILARALAHRADAPASTAVTRRRSRPGSTSIAGGR